MILWSCCCWVLGDLPLCNSSIGDKNGGAPGAYQDLFYCNLQSRWLKSMQVVKQESWLFLPPWLSLVLTMNQTWSVSSSLSLFPSSVSPSLSIVSTLNWTQVFWFLFPCFSLLSCLSFIHSFSQSVCLSLFHCLCLCLSVSQVLEIEAQSLCIYLFHCFCLFLSWILESDPMFLSLSYHLSLCLSLYPCVSSPVSICCSLSLYL